MHSWHNPLIAGSQNQKFIYDHFTEFYEPILDAKLPSTANTELPKQTKPNRTELT
jgi:hypothetical protein